MRKILLITLLLALTYCASNPDSIDAAYVSPLKYSSYDCGQIGMELDYVGQRTNVLYQNLKAKRQNDNWQMGVGLLLFWPTLFALEGGDGADAAEYAQLKGEYEALRQNSTQKRCGLAMQSPDEILDAARNAERNQAEAEVAEPTSTLSEQLLELDALLEQGVISEQEHQAARQRALGIN